MLLAMIGTYTPLCVEVCVGIENHRIVTHNHLLCVRTRIFTQTKKHRCSYPLSYSPTEKSIPFDDGLHGTAIGCGCVACIHTFWNIHHTLMLCTKGDQCVGLGTHMLTPLHHCTNKLTTLTESQCIIPVLELGDRCDLITGSLDLVVDVAKVARPNVLGLGGASGDAVHVNTFDMGCKV